MRLIEAVEKVRNSVFFCQLRLCLCQFFQHLLTTLVFTKVFLPKVLIQSLNVGSQGVLSETRNAFVNYFELMWRMSSRKGIYNHQDINGSFKFLLWAKVILDRSQVVELLFVSHVPNTRQWHLYIITKIVH